MNSGSDQPPRRYAVRLARRAVRSLADWQRRDQQRIRAAIDLLAENPRPPNSVALQEEAGVYRVRVGDYRIVYEVRGEGCYIVAVIHGSRDLPRHVRPAPKPADSG